MENRQPHAILILLPAASVLNLKVLLLLLAVPFTDVNCSYLDAVKGESPFCSSMETCTPPFSSYNSFPGKNCYCDPLCAVTGDCCPGYQPLAPEVPMLSASVLDCVRMENVREPTYGVTMVTKCDDTWQDEEIKTRCETDTEAVNTFETVPVTEPTTGIAFRNMYCALCNNFYDYLYWQSEITCQNETLSPDCTSEIRPPVSAPEERHCPPTDSMYSTCSDNSLYNSSQADVVGCINGDYSLVYSGNYTYKNKQCALCNGVPPSRIYCEPDVTSFLPPFLVDDNIGHSFRMLVDYNSGHYTAGERVHQPLNCQDDEIYDPLFEKCRSILCPESFIPKRGRCMPYSVNGTEDVLMENGSLNCTFIKLEPCEYEFTRDSKVLVLSSMELYGDDMFRISDSDVYVCLASHTPCADCRAMFRFDDAEVYLSFVSSLLSLIALATTFVVYSYFRELLNIPGKILLSLVASLFLGQLLFILAPEAQKISKLCIAFAIMMHYFFLAAFCWVNIMAYDILVTFTKQFASTSRSSSRFYKYMIYGWMVPFVVVSAAVIVEHVDITTEFYHFKPRYGRAVCWITSRDALLLYFAGPLCAFKLFDLVAFIVTSVQLVRVQRQTGMARRGTRMSTFLIHLKLSLVMGLTWLFAFLANIAHTQPLWYCFIACNCLQGLFIGISFLCTRKVRRLLKKKLQGISVSQNTQSSNEDTSLTVTRSNYKSQSEAVV